MTIKQRLQVAMTDAMRMRNKKKETLTTIRMIIDRIQKKEKDLMRELSEEEVVQILQTFNKQIQEEMDGYLSTNNVEMFKKVTDQYNLTMMFLPKQMTAEEIGIQVQLVISEIKSSGQTPNKGLIMKNVMPLVKGKADNKLVNKIVTTALV